jgi:hypothetical protein
MMAAIVPSTTMASAITINVEPEERNQTLNRL